jgi:REP element-mobilizing transposase RayT
MDKFKNTYRIPSARHPHWDYRWAGAYFITICTHNRIHYFGEIENGAMQLSQVGVIADIFWYEIPHHAKNVELGAFVVMPNHIHGILILTGNDDDNGNDNVDVNVNVETGHALSLPPTDIPTDTPTDIPTDISTDKSTEINSIEKTIGQQRFQNIGKNSVSSIVGSYKSAVTKHANRLGYEFAWQTRFHDHIIRDKTSFEKISNYIINNPANWQDDQFLNA